MEPPENDEEGQMYSGRHDHNLCYCEGLWLYKCRGCKEYGAKVGFKCRICPDFILHEACATLSDDSVHPLCGQERFKFRRKTHLPHNCDACGEVIRGFVFESHSANLRLHPVCMVLPPDLNYGGHNDHVLELITDKSETYSCTRCGRNNADWRYQCKETACRLSIDFNCAKADLYKLSDYGISRVARRSLSTYVWEKFSDFIKFVSGKAVSGAAEGSVNGLIQGALNKK